MSNERTLDIITKVITILICATVFFIILFTGIKGTKRPDPIDIEYAKIMWKEGLGNITYEDISIETKGIINSEELFKKGICNFVDKGEVEVSVKLKNKDEIYFKNNKASIISENNFFQLDTVFYEIEFTNEEPSVKKIYRDIVLSYTFIIVLCVFATLTAFCLLVLIFYIFKYFSSK